uniref:AMP-dependent synthetase/ligase domain-containing protein n=1 Tax=Tetradesmus obliquus TaxID=3088 RepID=A0A383VM20_TETOB|eukprot:jgi/Sobl393_1/19959/SZX66587.1
MQTPTQTTRRGACEVFSSLRTFRDDLAAYPPDHFVCVPLVLDSLHSKVMAKLKSEATGAKGAIVAALLAASAAHVAARRTVTRLDLTYARASPPAAVRLAALVMMAVTTPLYALAQKLVFSKVRAALGVRKTIVSGGGSLPPHLDSWYEALGLPVLNGWGLSETSPVLACRRLVANVRGSVGLPVPGTRLLVVDPTSHKPLPDGQQGLILAAGPGVMAGYYNDAAATRKAFIDGWFDTGDLGWRAPSGVAGSNMAGHIVLSGRAKDTIVLLSGKNVEPAPIEAALERSSLIKHALLLGQDRRELGALVFPDEEALAAAGGLNNIDGNDEKLQAQLAREVAKYNSTRPDYRPEDHIGHIQVIRAPLSVESGTLTRTMKPRRPAIMELYAPQVQQLLGRLRG